MSGDVAVLLLPQSQRKEKRQRKHVQPWVLIRLAGCTRWQRVRTSVEKEGGGGRLAKGDASRSLPAHPPCRRIGARRQSLSAGRFESASGVAPVLCPIRSARCSTPFTRTQIACTRMMPNDSCAGTRLYECECSGRCASRLEGRPKRFESLDSPSCCGCCCRCRWLLPHSPFSHLRRGCTSPFYFVSTITSTLALALLLFEFFSST